MHNIYFTRHGETVWNVENKICGMTDSPLTARGQEQARQLGALVRDSGLHIDEILYSPLSRAADTAKAIAAATGLPARCEPRLREQCFGKYEGTPRDGAEFRISKTHFADRYDGGESMMQLAQRIYNLLDELKADTGKTYLLVAHNGIARVEYRILATAGENSLVEVTLHTGRTHQIRVQFASRKHPLYGDGKYGSRQKGSIALQSCGLRFVHPDTGKPMAFSLPLPAAAPWKEFLE